MTDQEQPQTTGSSSNLLAIIIAVVFGVYAIGATYYLNDARQRVAVLEQKSQTQDAASKEIVNKLHATNKSLEDTATALGSKVGMTQEELNRRTSELRRQQQMAETKLTAEQQKTQQALQGVSGEVTGVKSEVGVAKTDIASTKTDLEATKAKLEKAIGDLGVQSGLIARNAGELEALKHKGDRNYYEFTLKKNERVPVSNISLILKKSDAKKSKFTLNVLADDKTIEKKDRTANEPLQFYTGRDKNLYELVVFSVDKDKVTGYLSTPK